MFWRPIRGFEDTYEVSNKGHVRSIDRKIVTVDMRVCTYRGRMLSPYRNSDGYLQYNLSKKGKRVTVRAHRLIRDMFYGSGVIIKLNQHEDV